MSSGFRGSTAFIIISAVFAVIFFISSVALFTYHLLVVSTSKELAKQFASSLTLSFVMLGNSTVVAIFLVLKNPFGLYSNCLLNQYGGLPSYSLFKCIMYLTLIVRVWKSFANTPIGYSPKKLLIWAFILIGWTMFNMINGPLTAHIVPSNASTPLGPNCFMVPTTLHVLSIIILDLLSTVVNCILFVRPLIKLSNATDCSEPFMLRLAIKQCILSFIASISSIIAIVGIGLTPGNGGGQVWISFDCLISSVSIMLLYIPYNKISDKLFGGIIDWISRKVSKQDVNNLVNNMDSVAMPSSSSHTVDTNVSNSKSKPKNINMIAMPSTSHTTVTVILH